MAGNTLRGRPPGPAARGGHVRSATNREGQMRARYLLLVAVGAAALFGATAVRAAHGDTGRTLTFTVPPPPPRDQHQVDVPPRGLSLGDQTVGAVSLRTHGQLFGRALV